MKPFGYEKSHILLIFNDSSITYAASVDIIPRIFISNLRLGNWGIWAFSVMTIFAEKFKCSFHFFANTLPYFYFILFFFRINRKGYFFHSKSLIFVQFLKFATIISLQYYNSIPPENIRNRKAFWCFQELQKCNIRKKWLNPLMSGGNKRSCVLSTCSIKYDLLLPPGIKGLRIKTSLCFFAMLKKKYFEGLNSFQVSFLFQYPLTTLT